MVFLTEKLLFATAVRIADFRRFTKQIDGRDLLLAALSAPPGGLCHC